MTGRKRPTLSEAEVTTITTAVMLGLTDEATVALIFDQHDRQIPTRTWRDWKTGHPQVKQAIAIGRANSEHVAAKVIWSAMSQTHDSSLAFKAAVHWERSRHGRKDVAEQRIDITSSDGSAGAVQIYLPDNGRGYSRRSNKSERPGSSSALCFKA
jgi:hypothetical protein